MASGGYDEGAKDGRKSLSWERETFACQNRHVPFLLPAPTRTVGTALGWSGAERGDNPVVRSGAPPLTPAVATGVQVFVDRGGQDT
ncbi:MAG: hypothetical protein U1E22_02680, partial [Coriobacteriia bacterium]|nr:hypothetical protein [Coriobacteriia bacterium]